MEEMKIVTISLEELKCEIKKIIQESLEDLPLARTMSTEKEEVLTREQLKSFLNISDPTLRKLEKQRILKVKYVGTQKRYLKSWVIAYLEGKKAA